MALLKQLEPTAPREAGSPSVLFLVKLPMLGAGAGQPLVASWGSFQKGLGAWALQGTHY